MSKSLLTSTSNFLILVGRPGDAYDAFLICFSLSLMTFCSTESVFFSSSVLLLESCIFWIYLLARLWASFYLTLAACALFCS